MTSELAKRARALLDSPYVHQGRGNGFFDCIGFTADAVQFPVEKIPVYPADPVNGELEKAMNELCGLPVFVKPNGGIIDIKQLREGDIAGIQYKGPIRHMGLILNHPTLKGELSLIHTNAAVGKVTEHILDFKWLRRIEMVWRLESV